MATVNLLESITSSDYKHLHFLNGRVLTAEEMAVEQRTNVLEHGLLGLGIGAGVVRGLRVTAGTARATVGVTAGTAIAADGSLVRLGEDATVSLVESTEPTPTNGATDSPFHPCHIDASDDLSGNGTTAYLLLLAPTFEEEGQAVTHRLGNGSKCAYAYDVHAVQFRLVRIAHGFDTSTARFRNQLAHLCLGTALLLNTQQQPFARKTSGCSPYVSHGIADKLRDDGTIEPCEVPLAVLEATNGTIGFVDMWAVRRSVSAPSADFAYPFHTTVRRPSEAHATFLQFQDQLAADPTVRAHDLFRYLPAAGYLRGVENIGRFFNGIPYQTAIIDPDTINAQLQASFWLPPIDLDDPPPIVVYRHARNDNIHIFTRLPRSYEVEEPDDPPIEEQPRTGEVRAHVTVPVELLRSGFQAAAIAHATHVAVVPPPQLPSIIHLIEVTATNPRGVQHTLEFSMRATELLNVDGLRQETVRLVYLATLLADKYVVGMTAASFVPSKKPITLNSGATVTVNFTLERRERGTEEVPPRIAVRERTAVAWIGRLAEQLPPEVDERWLIEPPEFAEMEVWARRLGELLGDQYPDEVIDPLEPRIFIDPAADPTHAPEHPIAYVEYGKGGAAVPLTIIPQEGTLDRPTTIAKGNLEGVDVDMTHRLDKGNISELDELAYAPAVFVSDALNVDVGTAALLTAQAQERVSELQGSPLLLTGVGAGEIERMAAVLDVATADLTLSTIANAKTSRLLTDNGFSSAAFATRIIDEARRAVPAAEWSLDDEVLGLGSADVVSLQTIGIETKADLRTRTDVVDALSSGGADAGFVSRIVEARRVLSATDRSSGRLETVVTDSGARDTLREAGIRNNADVLRANPDELETLVGADRATEIRTAALRDVLAEEDSAVVGRLVDAGLTDFRAILDQPRAVTRLTNDVVEAQRIMSIARAIVRR